MQVAETGNGIWFSIEVAGEEFVAFVTADALCGEFNKKTKAGKALRSIYRQHRTVIDAVAKRKFLNGMQRPVQLTSEDFVPSHSDISARF
jgi:hypothetical protein